MSRFQVHFLLCLTLLSSDLLAHGELPRPQWCEGGVPREVASFEFGTEALSERPRPGTCSANPGQSPNPKNCGQFDDDYSGSRHVGESYCRQFARPRRAGEIADAGTVVVIVTKPQSYLANTHHREYAIGHGLEGICVRCESSSASPIDPTGANEAAASE